MGVLNARVAAGRNAHNMSFLIIPDIHNKVDLVEKILDMEKGLHEKIIFLGDYFDNFFDTPKDAAKTAEWLKKSLTHKNRVHLIGNHDMSYAYPDNAQLFCPGFTPAKCEAVNKIMSFEDWDKIDWFHAETVKDKDVLFSHAGFTPNLYSDYAGDLWIPRIRDIVKNTKVDAKSGIYSKYLAAGHSRNGREVYGSFLWEDFWEADSANEIYQIVGHTPLSYFKKRASTDKTCNIVCLDTHLNYYFIMEDNYITAKISESGKVKDKLNIFKINH